MRVLYVTSRFPSITATFIANEMAAVTETGADVHIAPLWKPLPGHDGHPVEIPLLPKAVPFDLRNPRTWLAMAKAVVRRPSVLKLLAELVPGHAKSPWLFGKLLGSIPRGLFFGSWAADNDMDRLHAHFLTTPTTVAMIAGHVAGIPYSATAHAFDITSTDPRIMNGSVSLKCRRADSIVTISEYNRRDILSRWPELADIRLEVIYNGIDTSTFTPDRATPALSGALSGDGTVKILTVSSLIEKKGHEFMIRAVAGLRADGVDVRLDIYGEGPRQQLLADLIDELGVGDCVALRGPANQAEVVKLCQEADIFGLACCVVASDDADGLPTVLIEALAAGLPTVSTQVTGVPEIIIDGQTGRCVPPRDVEALQDAIRSMIANPDEARAMGAAGRQLVTERFRGDKAADELRTLWADTMAALPSGH
jgi:glycosyltransferase involved in cell wall biosynthesis